MTTPLKLSQIPTSYDHASIAAGDQFPLVHVAGPTDGLITLSEIVVSVQYRTGATLGGGVDNTVWADSDGYCGFNPTDSYTAMKPAATGSHADSGGKCFGPNSHANTAGLAEGNGTVAMLGATTAACSSNAIGIGGTNVYNQNCFQVNTGSGVQGFGDNSIGIGNGSGGSAWISSNNSMVLGTNCQAGPQLPDLDQIGGAWMVRNSGSGAGTARLISFAAQGASILSQFNPGDTCLLFNGTPNAATTLNGKRVTIAAEIDSTGNAGAFNLNWRGTYANTNSYAFGDGVTDGTNAYACIQATAATAQPLTNAAYWEILGPDNGSASSSSATPYSWSAANGKFTCCMVMTAAFADFNNAGGGTSSDFVNISQFSYHVAIGIGASATDNSQQYGQSNCMAVGVFVTNPNANSVLFGFASNEGVASPRGVLFCDATGVKISSKGAKLGGTISDHYTDAGTPNSTTETVLYSETLAAPTSGTTGLLDTNGDKVAFRYSGIFANTTGVTKELRIRFGSPVANVLLDTGAMTMTGAGTWDIRGLLIRVSSTSIRYIVECTVSGTSTIVPPAYGVLTGLSPNLNNNQTLEVTGQCGSGVAETNDIVAKLGTLKWDGAA